MTVAGADAFMGGTGLQAFRVGGSVRDELLGREPHDADYVVQGSTLDEIHGRIAVSGGRDIGPLRLRDGREVGVRFVAHDAGKVEVVLPRREASTGKGHRDFRIVSGPNITLAEDAARRDFTVNALYRDVSTRIVHDPTGRGRYDLDCRWIRTTHPDSFRDDPLRTLRALRFASTLGFVLVESTFREMVDHADAVTALTLKGVSATALDELCKLLMGVAPYESLRMMAESGVLDVLLPELSSILEFDQESAYHSTRLDEHTFRAVQAAADVGAPLRVRMALLFHDAGKPWMAWEGDDRRLHYYALTPAQARAHERPEAVHSHEWWSAWLADQAFERLNAPRAVRSGVRTLIERHMVPLQMPIRPIKVRTWRAELETECSPTS